MANVRVSLREKVGRLFSAWAIPGWIVGAVKVFAWVLNRVSDYDTLRTYGALIKAIPPAIWSFLLTPWAYLLGFAWLTLVILWPSKKEAPKMLEPNSSEQLSQFTPSGGGFYGGKVTGAPPPQIFVAHMQALIGSLGRDGFFRYRIVVAACSPKMSLNRFVEGRISCRLNMSNQPTTALTSQMAGTTLPLPEPSIERVISIGRLVLTKPDATTFPISRGGSVIILKQYLSPADSATITTALNLKRALEFDFTELALSVTSPEGGTERLALWDGIACLVGEISSQRLRIDKTKPGLSEMIQELLSQ